MTESSAIAISDLLRHSDWMRALARSLVRDSAAADDLVQDTWVSAISKPPQDRRNVKGWLSVVMRNALRQGKRGDERRESRDLEQGQVHSNETATDQIVEQFELQRQVAGLVMDLEEPDRTILLLRFYENLDSSQIAERSGINPNTVRGRIQGALTLLRSRLDDQHRGNRQAWCLAMAPFLKPRVVAASTTATASFSAVAFLSGVFSVKFLSLSAMITAVIVAVLFKLDRFPGFTKPSSDPVAVQFEALPVLDEVVANRSLVVQSGAVQKNEQPNVVSNSETRGITGRIVSELGSPVPQASIKDYEHETSSDTGGHFLLPISRITEADNTTLNIQAQGYTSRAVRVAWTGDGQNVGIGDVVLRPGGNIRGRVVDSYGAAIANANIALCEHEPSSFGYSRWRLNLADGEVRAMRDSFASDELGNFLLTGLPVGFVRLVASAYGTLATLSSPVEVRAGMESSGVELTLELLDEDQLIEGIIVDPFGNLVPFAKLSHRYSSLMSSGSGSGSVGDQGRFRFIAPDNAKWTMHAEDPELRWGDGIVHDIAPGTRNVVITLAEPVETHLTVVAPEAKTVSIALYSPDRRHHFDYHPMMEFQQGPITLRVPASEFLIEIEGDRYDIAKLGPYTAENCPRELQCQLVAIPGIRGTATHDDKPLEGATISIHKVANSYTEHNGFPVTVAPKSAATSVSQEDGAFFVSLRDSGTYILRADHANYAATELGPFPFDSKAGLSKLHAPLDVGGTIVGTVHSSSGNRVTGSIVGVSRGDGYAVTQRVGDDGAFRFDQVMPGPWTVKICEEEITPNRSSTHQQGTQPVAILEPNCHVALQQTTRQDLFHGETIRCELQGSFRWQGHDMQNWSARLMWIDQERVTEVAHAPLAKEGQFQLQAYHAGKYRLHLAQVGVETPAAELFADIELKEGTVQWDRTLPTASLTITEVPELSRETKSNALNMLVWSKQDLTAIATLLPNEDGIANLAIMPTGVIALAKRTAVELSQFSAPTQWPTIGSIQLNQGEHKTLKLTNFKPAPK